MSFFILIVIDINPIVIGAASREPVVFILTNVKIKGNFMNNLHLEIFQKQICIYVHSHTRIMLSRPKY